MAWMEKEERGKEGKGRKGRGGEGMMDREVLRVETYQRNQTLPCDLIIHFS